MAKKKVKDKAKRNRMKRENGESEKSKAKKERIKKKDGKGEKKEKKHNKDNRFISLSRWKVGRGGNRDVFMGVRGR